MEDHIRRMILAGNDSTTRRGETISDQRPVIRLPPYATPQSLDPGHFAGSTHGRTSTHNMSTERLSFNNLPHHMTKHAHDPSPTRNLAQIGPQYPPPHGALQREATASHQQPSVCSQTPAVPPHIRAAQRHGYRLQLPLDPDAFDRGGHSDRAGRYQQHYQTQRQLFDPASSSSHQNNSYGGHQARSYNQHLERQSEYLNEIAIAEVLIAEMTESERVEKETFRIGLQRVISDLCEAHPERFPPISLECFGSFRSGFASQGSDMDLAIVSEDQSRAPACFSLMKEDLPRVLEERLLGLGYGARLLTRTRVPIIKICQKPGVDLLANLREERGKWDALPDDKKYPHLYGEDDADHPVGAIKSDEASKPILIDDATVADYVSASHGNDAAPSIGNGDTAESQIVPSADGRSTSKEGVDKQAARQRHDQKWTRERKSGPLDFPKDGIGIQSDINFFNPLGLHNTQMLRNYSLCDLRVRPMVLFVKAWAKRRKINSAYSGTLSSYGYVLMVLHYLINIAQPAVLPNLQSSWRPNSGCTLPGATRTEVDHWVVDFWRSEVEITGALQHGQMSNNNETIGSLLVGFFSYFSSVGGGKQFHWMKDVLSLRTSDGILSKEEKGWVKAVTEESEGRKVQQRYLFCIEDPFELSHNVSRTVTHYGIVAIRDEFRRAKRILLSIGNGAISRDGLLMDALVDMDHLEKGMESHNIHKLVETQHMTPNNAVLSRHHTSQHKQPPQSIQNDRNNGPARSMQQPLRPRDNLNVMDDAAFPSLGGLKPAVLGAVPKQRSNLRAPHARKKQTSVREDHNSSEISGDRAKEYLAKVNRRNAESAAELVAKRAAEAVLGRSD